MFCQNCGTKNADGVKFCSNCGNPMPTPKPVEETVVASEPTPVAPVAPVAPVEPVAPAPAPVYAPVEPVAPAPAPAPEKPKKKNNNIIIIAIVAVIAVAAIVVGILFGTGVIGGDSKKEDTEETTKAKTEKTETVKDEEKEPDFNYAEVWDALLPYCIAVDDNGAPIFDKYGCVTVYETNDEGKFVYDEDGNVKTYTCFLEFELDGTIYKNNVAVEIPDGWKLMDENDPSEGFYHEKYNCVIAIDEYSGNARTLDAVVNEYYEDLLEDSEYATSVTEMELTVDGHEAVLYIVDFVNDTEVVMSCLFAVFEVDGEFYNIAMVAQTFNETEDFYFDTFLTENVKTF